MKAASPHRGIKTPNFHMSLVIASHRKVPSFASILLVKAIKKNTLLSFNFHRAPTLKMCFGVGKESINFFIILSDMHNFRSSSVTQ